MMRFTMILTLIATLFSFCTNKPATTRIRVSETLFLDSLPGQCPYFTRDTKGNTVLSWVRMNTDSTSAFCYAVSETGTSFGRTIEVPGSSNIQPHGENLPKIVFKPSGEVIALWGSANPNPSNKYSGRVSYVQSFDNGQTWSKVKPLITDTAGFDQRYYDVALLPNGEAGVIWLDNRKTAEGQGSALYFATTSGNNGFSEGKRISEPCCPCCRTDLFVDSKGGIHALYRGIIQDSIRDMVHIVSSDNGNTFSTPRRIHHDNWVINGCPHTGPAMTESRAKLHFTWFTGGGKNPGCYYTQSVDDGKTFENFTSVSSRGSHPQMTPLPETDKIVIVWDEFTRDANKQGKQIGIKLQDENGMQIQEDLITPDTSFSSYPVIAGVDKNTSLVSFTVKKGERNFIGFKSVRF